MEPAAVLLECHTGIHIDMGSARASRVVYRSLLKNAVVAVRVSGHGVLPFQTGCFLVTNTDTVSPPIIPKDGHQKYFARPGSGLGLQPQ